MLRRLSPWRRLDERTTLEVGVTRKILGQTDATRVPRYAGIGTFARLPTLDQVEAYDVAVVGVPFDAGVTYRPGARFGPGAIRQASRLLRPYNPALQVRPFDDQQVVDAGDIAASPFSIEDALGAIEERLAAIIATGARYVLLGGDHTIALPSLRALHRRHGPIALVHFDAHLDTWDTYFGAPYTHGTPFRRAFEEGLLDPNAAVHVGIRGSLYAEQDLGDDARMGFSIITTSDVETIGVGQVSERIFARAAHRPVYVSVDVDVLDPAHAPGTGTPEAGGLTSRELLTILRSIARVEMVGADIVEVSPQYDHAEITAVAAANVVYELLSAMALKAR
jgi:agmatinase